MTMNFAENWSAYPLPSDMWQASDPSLGPYIPNTDPVPTDWSFVAQATPSIDFAPSVGFGRTPYNKVLALPFLVHTITNGVTPIKVNSGKSLIVKNTQAGQVNSTPHYYAGWFKISNFNSAPIIIAMFGNRQSQSAYVPTIIIELKADGQLTAHKATTYMVNTGYNYNSNKRFLNYYETPNGADEIDSTSTGVVSAATWHFLEVKITANAFPDSLIHVEIRLDNTPVITSNNVDIIRTAAFDRGALMSLCHYPVGTDFGAGLGVRTNGVAGTSGVVTQLYWDSVFMHTGVNSVDGFAGPSTVYALKADGVNRNGTGPTYNHASFTSTSSPFENAVHTRDNDYVRAITSNAILELTHESLPEGSPTGEIWAVGSKLSAVFETDDVQIINSALINAPDLGSTDIINAAMFGFAAVSIINNDSTAIFRDEAFFHAQQTGNIDWTTEAVAAINSLLWYDA